MGVPLTRKDYSADVIIIGGGLAGISAAIELLDNNKSVVLLDRDREEKFGGLAKESFGGILMVDTNEQRRMGIKDSPELALSDWLSFAEFGEDDLLPRKWAEYYVNAAKDEIYKWLLSHSVKFLPIVNWPERGLFVPGNSVPRWHIAKGTGFGIIRELIRNLNNHRNRSKLSANFCHNVTDLNTENNKVIGCSGIIEDAPNRMEFTARGAVIVASGGICGGNLTTLRKYWNPKWGVPPKIILNGAHKYGDGSIHFLVEKAGGNLTHMEKQHHYAAGIHHPNPGVFMHGLSLVPPKSALWVNSRGKRIGPVPLVTGFDTHYLVESVVKEQNTWQILNFKIAVKELAVSGSEYMTAFKDNNRLKMLKQLLFGNKELVNRLLRESKDFVVANSLKELISKMNALNGDNAVDYETLSEEIKRYDENINRGQKYHNDDQIRRIVHARQYIGDRLRTCKFQKIVDKKAMPLIAIREYIVARKSLGGIQTDLDCRVLNKKGDPIAGLYAIGESAGFGGGGIHGKRSLEGTFLGSCILTGRRVGKVIA